MVREHLAECQPYYKEGDTVFDPFFGQGAYYNLYDEFFPNCKKEFTEIAMGKDFFEYDGKPDIVVSNPPFSLLNRIFVRLLELRPKCISLLVGCMNMTRCRLNRMEQGGYTLVRMLVADVHRWFSVQLLLTWVRNDVLGENVLCKVHGSPTLHENEDYVLPSKRRVKKEADETN